MNLLKKLDKLDALEKEAMPGPWEYVGRGIVQNVDDEVGYFSLDEDAALVGPLRNNYPELSRALREVGELECMCNKGLEDWKRKHFDGGGGE